MLITISQKWCAIFKVTLSVKKTPKIYTHIYEAWTSKYLIFLFEKYKKVAMTLFVCRIGPKVLIQI